jgi:hypothetical protein
MKTSILVIFICMANCEANDELSKSRSELPQLIEIFCYKSVVKKIINFFRNFLFPSIIIFELRMLIVMEYIFNIMVRIWSSNPNSILQPIPNLSSGFEDPAGICLVTFIDICLGFEKIYVCVFDRKSQAKFLSYYTFPENIFINGKAFIEN